MQFFPCILKLLNGGGVDGADFVFTQNRDDPFIDSKDIAGEGCGLFPSRN